MVTANGSADPSCQVGILDSPRIIVSSTEENDYSSNMMEENANIIQVRVTCPNLGPKCSKIFRFSLVETVWEAKQMVLIEFSVSPNLQDPLNFGFYLPPHAGRAGKFLDEERRLSEYPMDNVQAHLEFRYKRRIFRQIYTPDEKKLLKVNSKKYRKRFMDALQCRDTQDMQKLLEKGLDPNFHEEKTGDTPLIVAAMMDESMEILKLLVQYGAYLDYRSLKGKTALHIIAATGKLNVLKNFKALGASPNYKDGKGLTPLYQSILCGSDLTICEHLLNDNARIGVSDIHGCEEIHQACKLGYAQHLELLILHGANVDSRTASGNTPLHICVLENQLNCARVLLRHGADYTILNYARQSAYHVSITVNHSEIGQLLHKLDNSDTDVNTNFSGSDQVERVSGGDYPDAAPPVSKERADSVDKHDKHRKASKESCGDLDELSDSESDSDEEEKLKPEKPCRTFSNAGVGTKRSPAPIKIKPLGTPTLRKRLYASVPGRQFLVINDYEPKHSGELALKKGDLLEVLYIGDNGYWEGHIHGRGGWFPSYCVQEVKHNDNLLPRQLSWFGKKTTEDENKFVNMYPPTARSVILKRTEKGFGFQLRGANSHVPYIDFVPSPQYPALQYIGDVDKGGVAEKAGLNAGDFVLEINNENVINATHGYAVSLINKGSKTLAIKVISVAPESVNPELVLPSGELKAKNIVEVREKDLKESGSVNGKKGAPPTPPMRSFSATLAPQNNSEISLLSEGSVATVAETVTFGKTTVNRKSSVKGIWSGNAFRLQGNDIKIREDDISRGISRKQKAVSTDESCKPIAKVPAFDTSSLYEFRMNGCISNERLGHAYNEERGRANSLENGDSKKLSRSHTLDFDYTYDRGKLDRQNRGSVYSNPQHGVDTKHEGLKTYYKHQVENQQYATVRQHNHVKQGVHRSQSIQNSMDQYTHTTHANDYLTCSTPNVLHADVSRSENSVQDACDSSMSPHIVGHEMLPEMSVDRKSTITCGVPDSSSDVPYCRPPESDGLIRLQNQRQGMGQQRQVKTPVGLNMDVDLVSTSLIKQQVNDPLYSNLDNSSSCVSLDSTYSKDSGYGGNDNDHQLHSNSPKAATIDDINMTRLPSTEEVTEPYANSSHSSVEDSATSYLDVVIADAEATINYAIISPCSSSLSQNDVESNATDADSVLSSPNSSADNELGCTGMEFPPPPEFLTEEEISTKDPENKIPCLRNNETPSRSDPPPPYTPSPYTPYISDSIGVTTGRMNVPNTLQNKCYIEWTSADVCDWLKHLCLGQYMETFVDNDIEGKHLAELTKDELKELGVTKLGHRMTLDDAIAKLCRNTP